MESSCSQQPASCPLAVVGSGPNTSSKKRPGPLSLFQTGKELLHSNPYAQEDIQDRLQSLNHKWEELSHKTAEQGDRLPQTRQQGQLLELLQVPGEGGMGWGHKEEDWGLAGAGWELAEQKRLERIAP